MLFNVPQFIDIEDKIVGPLTAKQLGWIAAAAICILIAWGSLDFSAFIMAAIVIAALFGALAFYKPYNQPFYKFILSGFQFFTRPKIYIWQRHYETIGRLSTTTTKKKTVQPQRKNLTGDKIKEISNLLDRR